MKQLASFGWMFGSSSVAACAVAFTGILAITVLAGVGCSKTESLGTRGGALDGGGTEHSAIPAPSASTGDATAPGNHPVLEPNDLGFALTIRGGLQGYDSAFTYDAATHVLAVSCKGGCWINGQPVKAPVQRSRQLTAGEAARLEASVAGLEKTPNAQCPLDAFTFTLRVDRVDGRAKAYAGACGPSPADGRLDDDQLLRLYELLGELAFEGADAGGTGGMGGTGTGGMGGTGTGGTGTGGTGTGGTGGDGSTHPACIIGGKRYEHLDVVSRRGCASCVCLDGHIGGCTGACNGVDAGPPLSLPDCGIDGRLEGACAECADGNCSAYEFKCYTMGPNCESGSIHQCGAEQTCHTDVCTDEVQCG